MKKKENKITLSLPDQIKRAEELSKSNYPEAYRLAEDIFLHSITINDYTHQAHALFVMGVANFQRGKIEEAKSCFEQTVKLVEESKAEFDVFRTYNALGIVYRNLKNSKEALRYYLKAVQSDKPEILSSAYNNIALFYREQKDYSKAEHYYLLGMEIWKTTGNNEKLAGFLTNLGIIHQIKGERNKALECFESAVELAEKANLPVVLQVTYANLGDFYVEEKDLPGALEYYKKALEITNHYGLENYAPGLILQLGMVYFELGYHQLGKDYFSSAIDRAKAHSLPKEQEILQLAHQKYALFGNFENAYSCLLRLNEILPESNSPSKERDIEGLRVEFEFREKESQIEQLTRENRYQALLLEKSEQIARQNEELKQFTYIASHDLREPLRMVTSFTDLLEKKLEDKLDKDTRDYMFYIRDGVSRMNELLSDILQYSTLDNPELRKEEVNLQQLFEDVMNSFKTNLLEIKGTVKVGKLPVIVAFKTQMLQLFQNLMSNAIKFRKAEEPLQIKVSSRSRGSFYEIRFSDNGIGISAENQQKIFQLFQRLHSRSQYEGTGIGLSICQKIVNKLGGDIRVESTPGLGATFIFTLPKE